MTPTTIIEALALPPGSRVDRRVPKKLLVENGAPTTTDKRHINEGIEDLHWVAALKPTTIGVSEYRDAVREYLEIAVLCLTIRTKVKVGRLIELVHRAVPYPVLLIADHAKTLGLSAAHIRWSQGESGKTVLDGEVASVKVDDNTSFLAALTLARQPQTTLYALYQGWIDTLLALHAARVTGTFAVAANAEAAAVRRDALQECARLDTEISRLRATAAKEKQMARRVELNLELKRLEAAQAAARANL
ncbi:MAG: DUF4391 domain-containing protein [Nitrospirales bacterium]